MPFLDFPCASKHRIAVGIDRKELITVRAGGIEIDIPKGIDFFCAYEPMMFENID